MASIQKVEGKNGISYRLFVTTGHDRTGKQIKHTKTWKPPEKMTERQAETAALKEAFKFEEQIMNGYIADDRQTFSEYAEYVLDLKARSGVKQKTVESYRFLLKRILPEIGFLKLSEIRPQHLNRMYAALSKEGIRNGREKATPKDDTIPSLLKSGKLSHAKAAKEAGISDNTVDAICKGSTVSLESAKKFCDAFSLDLKKTFTIEKDMRPLSSKSLLEYHRCVHAILAQAEKEMLVPYNAASKATPPKASRHEVNYFQPEELTAILDALDQEPLKWRTIVNLLIVTGSRRGEIAALKWKNVDFKNEKIKIDSTLLYSSGKGTYENSTKTGDTRFLKLPRETMALLKEYRLEWLETRLKNGDRWQGSDYVFIRDNGQVIHPDSITSYLSRFSAKHPELPHINPHAFRHTVASVLINNGQDIVTVSRRLGHSRVSTTTDVYSHIIAEADANASEVIADALLRRKA